ncbi:MAG TPA: serine hydrolase [Pyrinomonadaceae bacterium]|nr:serine hydrolase [Pyrinomonadaceae bacterium]
MHTSFQFCSLRFIHQSRRALAFSFVLLISTVCIPFGVHAQTGSSADGERLAQFQQSLDSLRRQYGVPGLSAAIVSNGHIIWEKGFGFQDVENQVPATPDTPYRTASITKTFASMLLMKCVELGTLNLDTQIKIYTSGIADSRVTVRHLFTHTSQSSPPGEKYLYSGDRYSYLTPVVQSCAGQFFREALAKTILDRLQMWDSVPGQDMESPNPEAAAMFTPETLERYTRVIQRLAKPYVVDNSGRPILSAYPPKGITAAAGLISTVRDLARYDAAIDQHVLLDSQTQEQAWTNHVNSKGERLPYGLGWFVQMYGGQRLIWHYGQWDTFSGLFLKVPGRNITLILLANSSRLSSPFSALGAGNVTGSPFANLFLQMLADPAAFRANPIELDSFFVRQHYLDFLNREPDSAGLEFWVNNIEACGADTTCRLAKRINTSAAYFLSTEFQETGYLVERLYKAAYSDATSTSTLGGTHQLLVPIIRFNEFLPDTQAIGQGVIVGQDGWATVLENNKRAFTAQLVTSPRFLAALPAAMSPAEFVDKLNANTGGALSQSERDQLVDDLNSGTKDRAQVLRSVAEDPDLKTAEFNRAFVLMQYFGYLRRNPNDSQESDYTGYDFWLTKLNQFNGNFVNADMVKAFLDSDEYQARFRQ